MTCAVDHTDIIIIPIIVQLPDTFQPNHTQAAFSSKCFSERAINLAWTFGRHLAFTVLVLDKMSDWPECVLRASSCVISQHRARSVTPGKFYKFLANQSYQTPHQSSQFFGSAILFLYILGEINKVGLSYVVLSSSGLEAQKPCSPVLTLKTVSWSCGIFFSVISCRKKLPSERSSVVFGASSSHK